VHLHDFRPESDFSFSKGDPGVGKTAIAEGLALRIIQGGVPESVVARVFSLDLGALLASTACKSAYEKVCPFYSTLDL
jgi:ATP-dependent Clp protease ATP-binding subunit ClpA